jgi:hypothetical protein
MELPGRLEREQTHECSVPAEADPDKHLQRFLLEGKRRLICSQAHGTIPPASEGFLPSRETRTSMARKQKPTVRKPAPSGRKGVKKTAAATEKETTGSGRENGNESGSLACQGEPILFPPYMDPLIREGIETFMSELESLLKVYTPRHVVVYRGRERLGVSKSIDELYAEMAARGIPDDELFYYTLTPIVTHGVM